MKSKPLPEGQGYFLITRPHPKTGKPINKEIVVWKDPVTRVNWNGKCTCKKIWEVVDNEAAAKALGLRRGPLSNGCKYCTCRHEGRPLWIEPRRRK